MGRTREKRHFRIKTTIRKKICRIQENGKNCNRKVHCRGLCSRHHTYFLRWKQIKKYGEKQKFVYVEDSNYEIRKPINLNQCRIKENGKNCKRSIHGRGLCARHWLTFERHGMLRKYGTASRKDPRTFNLKKKIVNGVCRVDENKKPCTNKSTSRGLCSKHYLRFLRDGRLKKFGKKVNN